MREHYTYCSILGLKEQQVSREPSRRSKRRVHVFLQKPTLPLWCTDTIYFAATVVRACQSHRSFSQADGVGLLRALKLTRLLIEEEVFSCVSGSLVTFTKMSEQPIVGPNYDLNITSLCTRTHRGPDK